MSRLIELDDYLDEVIELNLFPQGIKTKTLRQYTKTGKKLKISSGGARMHADKRLAKVPERALDKWKKKMGSESNAKRKQISIKRAQKKKSLEMKPQKNPLYDTRNPDFHGYR